MSNLGIQCWDGYDGIVTASGLRLQGETLVGLTGHPASTNLMSTLRRMWAVPLSLLEGALRVIFLRHSVRNTNVEALQAVISVRSSS
jgi:hypothetical protein